MRTKKSKSTAPWNDRPRRAWMRRAAATGVTLATSSSVPALADGYEARHDAGVFLAYHFGGDHLLRG